MAGRRVVYRAIDGTEWWRPAPSLWQRIRARVELWGVALGLWVLVTACAPLVPTPVPAPEPSPPGACEAAEANLERLQCTATSTSGVEVKLWLEFADACKASERDGLDWSAEHISCAETCDQATAAWVGKWRCPE
jgi:hypothetical protein